MDKLNLTHHISQKFNEELEDVRNRVLAMGGLVEQQIVDALRALTEGDSELGRAIEQHDFKVNQFEVSIDEECSRILARRQPAASDLRLILAIIKTITDLERIGDEAEKIGRFAARLAEQERPNTNYREIEHLGNHVRTMLHDALDAFARLDAEAAVRVAKEDERVDGEYDALSRQSITFMMEDPRTIRRVLDVMWSARALERIGDHAKNICEYVIYLVRGKDVRHSGFEAMEREVLERN
ncbi:MAG TPA: phosphate signaling complex protein PhoU [Gammaproteobacteria bacterium]|nr:phosphate signaling complex protein PhoU [Gammaproteobacteria bacterium]HEV2333087.1 phosphate signaling complex protein PhoU [Gammaproteobacteria bacterium]